MAMRDKAALAGADGGAAARGSMLLEKLSAT